MKQFNKLDCRSISVWLLTLTLLILFTYTANAQTTAFTYQGRLTDSSMSGNTSYTMKFRLFGSIDQNDQVGNEITTLVTPVNGVFTVKLDFGESSFPSGSNRWLEIQINNTTLSPRQQLLSSPYAIRSLNANKADALSASCNPCVADTQIVGVDATKITGVLSVNNGGTGSAIQNFVDLTTNQTIAGEKTFSGTIGGNLSFSNGQIINPRIENLAADPAPAVGRVYFNTTTNKIRVSNGTTWSDVGGSTRNIVSLVGKPTTQTSLTAGQDIPGRTVQITKLSATSKLRVTYSEWYEASPAATGAYAQIAMNGSATYSPGPIYALIMPFDNSFSYYLGQANVTGYVTGAGTGVYTFSVRPFGNNLKTSPPFQYTLEVEEIP